MEQTTSQRRFAERTHAAATCTLTEDGHVVGVATELCDVLLDPLQGFNLVEDTIVARHLVRTLGSQIWMAEETEDAQTVVDGNEHNVLCAPLLSVELWLRTKALAITTTMNPKGNRQFLAGIARSLCPYVQVQAVL